MRRQRGFTQGVARLLSLTSVIIAMNLKTSALEARAESDTEPIKHEIRLDSPGGVFEGLQVFDQEDTQTCYAFTAGQMIDAWMKKHQLNQNGFQVSPIPLAYGQAVRVLSNDEEKWAPDSVKFGYLTYAWEEAQDSGVCDYRKVNFRWANDSLMTNINSIQFTFFKEPEKPTSKEKVLRQKYEELVEYMEKLGLPAKRFPKYKKFREIYKKSENPLFAMDQIFQWSCKQPLRKKLPDLKALSLTNEKEPFPYDRHKKTEVFVDAIARQITSPQSLPVGLVYCANVLSNPNYGDVGVSGKTPANCYVHYSVVAGKRITKSGRLDFLVRNSVGKRCDFYGPRSSYCTQGQIWVPADRLAANTMEIFTIDE